MNSLTYFCNVCLLRLDCCHCGAPVNATMFGEMDEALKAKVIAKYNSTAPPRRYDIPSDGIGGWGIFVICRDGFFSVVSDFGSYGYRWTATGTDDFREFLVDIRPDYLAGKLAPDKTHVFDAEKTSRAIRDRIIELRKNRRLTKDEAAEEWEMADVDSEIEFSDWIGVTGIDGGDVTDLQRTSMDGELHSFCHRLYPRFVALLKDEIRRGIEWGGMAP